MIRTVSMAEGEPGLRPLSTALEDEGFDELGSGRTGRKLRAPSDGAIDAWQETASRESPRTICRGSTPEKGVRRDIDDNGDLLVRRIGQGRTSSGARSIAALAQAVLARSADRGPRCA